jgi:hypothetical protein
LRSSRLSPLRQDLSAIAGSSAKETSATKTLDKLRDDIQSHWLTAEDMPANPDVVVRVKFRLTRNGEIIGVPEVMGSGGNAAVVKKAMEGARRAVVRAAPYTLPRGKIRPVAGC